MYGNSTFCRCCSDGNQPLAYPRESRYPKQVNSATSHYHLLGPYCWTPDNTLVHLCLSPIPFNIIVRDDLAQFTKTQEEAGDIIAEFYKRHCSVLPATEDCFEGFDQQLGDKEKQGQEES